MSHVLDGLLQVGGVYFTFHIYYSFCGVIDSHKLKQSTTFWHMTAVEYTWAVCSVYKTANQWEYFAVESDVKSIISLIDI